MDANIPVICQVQTIKHVKKALDAGTHTKARHSMTASVKGFGCRPMTDGAANTEAGAGVRKPPRKETAGSGTRSCSGRYGDLSAGEEVRDGNRHP